MKVPFLDLKAQYESIKPEINDAIQQVLDSCAFAGGPFVEAFEKQFAEFCGCDHCIGVGSGTGTNQVGSDDTTDHDQDREHQQEFQQREPTAKRATT